MPYDQARKDVTLRMLKDPGEWPHWPLLPVKRSMGDGYAYDECIGVMQPGDPTVFMTNMGYLRAGRLADILKDIPKKVYRDYESVIEDGWVVD